MVKLQISFSFTPIFGEIIQFDEHIFSVDLLESSPLGPAAQKKTRTWELVKMDLFVPNQEELSKTDRTKIAQTCVFFVGMIPGLLQSG